MIKTSFVMFVFLLVAVSISSFAARFSYHHGFDTMPLELGQGIDINNPFLSDKLKCVTYDQDQLQLSLWEGVDDIRITTEEIKKRDELFTHLGISAELSAKYGFYSGDARVDFINESSFKENSLTWLFNAKVKYSPISVNIADNNVRLTEYANNILKKFGIEELIERCGSEYIYSISPGASLSVIFQASSVRTSEKKILKSVLNAQYQAGITDVDLKTKMQSVMRNLSTESRLKISVTGRGLDSASFVDLVTDGYDINKIKTIIKKAYAGISDTAVPYTFRTKSILKLIPDLSFSQFNNLQEKNSFIIEANKLKNKYERWFEKATRLIEYSNNINLSSSQRSEYEKAKKELNGAINTIRDQVYYCNEVAKDPYYIKSRSERALRKLRKWEIEMREQTQKSCDPTILPNSFNEPPTPSIENIVPEIKIEKENDGKNYYLILNIEFLLPVYLSKLELTYLSNNKTHNLIDKFENGYEYLEHEIKVLLGTKKKVYTPAEQQNSCFKSYILRNRNVVRYHACLKTMSREAASSRVYNSNLMKLYNENKYSFLVKDVYLNEEYRKEF